MFLVEGYQTLVTFSATPGLFLRVRELQPPEIDGGGEIDTTTMLNAAARTRSQKTLVHWNAITMQCQYDPFVYFQMSGTINVRQLMTVTFPDAAIVPVWGFVDKFTPTSLKEGEFPLAEVKFIPTHRTTTGAETLSVGIVGGNSLGLVVK